MSLHAPVVCSSAPALLIQGWAHTHLIRGALSIRIMSLVWDAPLPPRLMLVALALADMADDDGRSWPAIETLCRKTKQSTRTVEAALRELEISQALRREKRPHQSTVYFLTPATFAAQSNRQDLPTTPAEIAGLTGKNCRSPLHESSIEPSKNRQAPPPPKPVKQNGHTYTPPDWVPLDAWNGWIEARKKKNNAPTDRAKALAVLELDKLRQQGNDPETVLNQSTVRGWAGLFHVKPNGNGHDHGAALPWWSTDATIEAKAREIGISPRAGESWQQLKGRIQEKIS